MSDRLTGSDGFPERIVVKALVFNEQDRLLLLSESPQGSDVYEPDLPGGGVEPGETESEALERELREELDIVGRVAIGEYVGSTKFTLWRRKAVVTWRAYLVDLPDCEDVRPKPGSKTTRVLWKSVFELDPIERFEDMAIELATKGLAARRARGRAQ